MRVAELGRGARVLQWDRSMKALPWMLVLAACGPETTSFRTSDRADAADRTAAVYSVHLVGREAARVHVSSNGGYVSLTDEPMTHIGFEIRNTGARSLAFDGDNLRLELAGKGGVPLPAATFTTVTPLGPAHSPVMADTTAAFDAYFLLPVRPRAVESMRVHWTLDLPGARYEQTTTFVRDDDGPVTDPPTSLVPPSS
jgi:hypothetical protein